MLVFIDESGDPSFKTALGATPLFVVAMVIFRCPQSAAATRAAIATLRSRLRVKPEFKFSKSHSSVKDAYSSQSGQ